MTHVVHLTSVHYPFDPRIFHKQLRSLSAAGYRTTLLAHHEESTTRNGIRVRSVGDVDSRRERWQNLPSLYRTAKRIDADVYHFHDPELLPIGILLSRTTAAKVVYDVHEDYTDAIRVREWIPDTVKPPLTTLFPKLQSKAIQQLDMVVTADESTARKLETKSSVPVTTVRNLPRTNDIDIHDIDVERSTDYVLAYVGGLDRERGLLNMLQTTARLREAGLDVGLWLIGPFQDDDIEREARAFMDREGITDSVRLFGYVDYDDIFSYLSLADIGLLLVDEERFERNVPTKFFEYMYCELPVVSTEVPSLERFSDDDYCLRVSEDRLDEAVDPIADLLEDDRRRQRMGEAARKSVASEFSWEVEKDRLLHAYQYLVDT